MHEHEGAFAKQQSGYDGDADAMVVRKVRLPKSVVDTMAMLTRCCLIRVASRMRWRCYRDGGPRDVKMLSKPCRIPTVEHVCHVALSSDALGTCFF